VPTYQWLPRFREDLEALSPEERQAFADAVEAFVAALKDGRGRFPKALRVHRIDGTEDVWSLSWAGDGRATFSYGESIRPGEAHVIWRRVGSHSIYRAP
jgi:hypothetical protein